MAEFDRYADLLHQVALRPEEGRRAFSTHEAVEDHVTTAASLFSSCLGYRMSWSWPANVAFSCDVTVTLEVSLYC